MNAAHFAEGHEENVVISETDDFGECAAIVAGGFNAANFAYSAQRSFGFDDEADELHDATAILQHASVARALESPSEAGASGWLMVDS
jgi:hypothetical protein